MPTYLTDLTPDWLKRLRPENASVFDSPGIKLARWIANVTGVADPKAQVLGLMAPMETGPVGGLAGKLGDLVAGIKAYHGSPHDFDAFSMSKIGTGEGAQAYGHGLYFAEKEGTAQAYRNDLGRVVKSFGGQPTQTAAEDMAHDILTRSNGDVTRALQTVDEWGDAGVFRGTNEGRAMLDVKRAISDNAGKPLGTTNAGKMYEVAIAADPAHFLDWDAPLSAQSPQVRDALAREWLAHPEAHASQTGADIYHATARSAAIQQPEAADLYAAASQRLQQAGIPGIKYLDAGSRAAGTGTRNYVVFDDKLVSIAKKYMLAGLGVEEAIRRASQDLGRQPSQQGPS